MDPGASSDQYHLTTPRDKRFPCLRRSAFKSFHSSVSLGCKSLIPNVDFVPDFQMAISPRCTTNDDDTRIHNGSAADIYNTDRGRGEVKPDRQLLRNP